MTKTKAVVLVGVLIVTLLLSAHWPAELLAFYVFVIGLCALRMLWMVMEMKKSFVHLHEIAAQMAETQLNSAKRYDEQELHVHVALVQTIAADIRALGRRAGTRAGTKNGESHQVATDSPGQDSARSDRMETGAGEVVIAEPAKDGE